MKPLREALISKDTIKWASIEINQSTLKAKDYYVFYCTDIEALKRTEKRFKNDFQILKCPEKFSKPENKGNQYRTRLVPKEKIDEIVNFYIDNGYYPCLYEFGGYQTIGDFLKDWAKKSNYYSYTGLLKRIQLL